MTLWLGTEVWTYARPWLSLRIWILSLLCTNVLPSLEIHSCRQNSGLKKKNHLYLFKLVISNRSLLTCFSRSLTLVQYFWFLFWFLWYLFSFLMFLNFLLSVTLTSPWLVYLFRDKRSVFHFLFYFGNCFLFCAASAFLFILTVSKKHFLLPVHWVHWVRIHLVMLVWYGSISHI